MTADSQLDGRGFRLSQVALKTSLDNRCKRNLSSAPSGGDAAAEGHALYATKPMNPEREISRATQNVCFRMTWLYFRRVFYRHDLKAVLIHGMLLLSLV